MKRLCKGEASTLNVHNADLISDLPDELIFKIFSYLPTESIISTGILSKRWKPLWKQMRHLKFGPGDPNSSFTDNVISALISYQNPESESLTVAVNYYCNPKDLAIWITLASARNIPKLVLMINEAVETINVQGNVLGRYNTLKTLKLMGRMMFKIPEHGVSLNCLKELHLYHVRFYDEISPIRLLHGCPVLQVLVMKIYVCSGLYTLTIDSKTLIRLTLGTYECEEENIVIRTPRLQYLDIQKLDGVDSCSIENAPELREANINRHGYDIEENILASTTAAKNLYLSAPLKYPTGKVFSTLTLLEIDTHEDEWCNLLSFMIICSPNLQTLRIRGGWQRRLLNTWLRPRYVPTCMIKHLETLEWRDFYSGGPDHTEVAAYILGNSSQLRRATFTNYEPYNDSTRQEMQVMIAQVSNMPKKSRSCNLVFETYSSPRSSNRTEKDPDLEDFSY